MGWPHNWTPVFGQLSLNGASVGRNIEFLRAFANSLSLPNPEFVVAGHTQRCPGGSVGFPLSHTCSKRTIALFRPCIWASQKLVASESPIMVSPDPPDPFGSAQSLHQSLSDDDVSMRPAQRHASLASPSPRSSSGKPTPRRRRSMFTEIGLDEVANPIKDTPASRPRQQVRFRSRVDIHQHDDLDDDGLSDDEDEYLATSPDVSKMPSAVPASPFPSMPRFFVLVFMLAFIIPTLHNSPFFFKGKTVPAGVNGGVIRKESEEGEIVRRQDPTDVCKRWSQQSALVNGTLYLYGGRAISDASQTTNEWSMSWFPLVSTTPH